VFLPVGNFLSSPHVTHFCVAAVAQESFRNKNLGKILQHLLMGQRDVSILNDSPPYLQELRNKECDTFTEMLLFESFHSVRNLCILLEYLEQSRRLSTRLGGDPSQHPLTWLMGLGGMSFHDGEEMKL
jgi:hypothetical protein